MGSAFGEGTRRPILYGFGVARALGGTSLCQHEGLSHREVQENLQIGSILMPVQKWVQFP